MFFHEKMTVKAGQRLLAFLDKNHVITAWPIYC
jgi:hypothetical protein